MNTIILQDGAGNETAEIEVQSIKNGLLLGRILRKSFSPEQDKQFETFEELVNTQVFSLLDEAEKKIEANGYKIKDKDWQIFDIQIFDDQISLRIKGQSNDSYDH